MEKTASKKAKIEVEVDTTQLDEAIKKAKELSELLERINKLKNARNSDKTSIKLTFFIIFFYCRSSERTYRMNGINMT